MTSHEALPPDPRQEGLQYLCTKYSSLINRLREEVLGRQQAEGEARLYERRLREEVSLREAERRQSEETRQSLQEEIRTLRALHQEDHTREPAHVLDQAAAGGEVLLRQGEELVQLRREHAESLAHRRATSEELAACREHLARWRHSAGELEAKLSAMTSAHDEAESRARLLQEEMRQALRSASAARAREGSTASFASRSQRELRSREARLTTVRKEGQRFAVRASSAERRLHMAESYRVAAERLCQENHDLRMRLEAESRLLESARLDIARAEAGEVRASAGVGEFQTELRAKETLATAARQRVAEVEGELSHARARLDQLEGERSSWSGTTEALRKELKASREEREETQRERDKATSALAESRRRIDRGMPQLAECKRKLQNAEEGLAKATAEAADERRARERCHAEAIRSGEKLRLARAQSSQLRDRVRTLEEVELRYPSRLRAGEVGVLTPEADHYTYAALGRPALGLPARSTTAPVEMAPALTPSPLHSPRCFSHAAVCARHDSPSAGVWAGGGHGEMSMVREFVAREEQRLPERGIVGESFEEPRPSIRAQSSAPLLRRAASLHTFIPTAASSTPAGANEAEVAALLAAQPRVLKLPEPLHLSQAEKPAAQAGGG